MLTLIILIILVRKQLTLEHANSLQPNVYMTKQTFILTDSVFWMWMKILFSELETLDRCPGRQRLALGVYVTVCAGVCVLHEVCFPA